MLLGGGFDLSFHYGEPKVMKSLPASVRQPPVSSSSLLVFSADLCTFVGLPSQSLIARGISHKKFRSA